MRNPWLDIPLGDYEAHMALPYVAQARLLAELLDEAIARHRPRSVAVLGCAGGNGFERVPASVERLVGVDLNPAYIARARERYAARFAPGRLELLASDVQTEAFSFAPVDLNFAGLLFEYVDLSPTLANAACMLRAEGVLVAVLQLPGDVAVVTPSPYTSLAALSSVMRLVTPHELQSAAEGAGFRFVAQEERAAAGGKRFQVQTYLANRKVANVTT
jgi:predicted TPR repeat methyltransferase